jgi:hypothetical protein
MNLNELYKPIGRLYEETPSADYAGDYLAANGWYNATDEDTAVASAKSALASNLTMIKDYEAEYTDLYTKFGTNCTFNRAVSKTCRNAVQAKLKFSTIIFGGPVKWLGLSLKGCYSCPGGVLGYEDKQTMKKYLESVASAISNLKSKIPALQTAVDRANADKLKSTEASQETKSKTIDLKGIQEKAEAEKAKAKAEAESKQKQTDAELRAKKIFLAIIASGVILSAAGFAIIRK